jgi:hypothetical protein
VKTKTRRRSIGLFPIVSLARIAAVAAVVLSTSSAYSGELDSERDEDVDIAFVGSSREAGTLKPIPGVTIRAEYNGRRLLIRTNSEGVYKLIPGFGSDVKADQVTISCSKDGYDVIDVNRRRQPSDKNVKELVVAECVLAPKK